MHPIQKYIVPRSAGAANSCPSGYKKEIEFHNQTPTDVWVTDRNNVSFIIPGCKTGISMYEKSNFFIREIHTILDMKNIVEVCNALEHLNHVLGASDELRLIFFNSLKSTRENPLNRNVRIAFDYYISHEELTKIRAIHDKATGFTLSTNNCHLNALNPESKEAELEGNIREHVVNRPNGLLFEIVDNNQVTNKRFCFSGNQVITVPVITDIRRSSGLYVHKIKDFGFEKSETETEFYSVEAVENGTSFVDGCTKYGLWLTKEEALTAGKPELIAKFNIEKLQEEIREKEREHKETTLRMEAQNKEDSYRHAKEMQDLERARKEDALEHEKKIQALETARREEAAAFERAAKFREEELARLKDEIERRKAVRNDHYDERSSSRKDTSEIIKFIPAVIAGVVGIALLWRR